MEDYNYYAAQIIDGIAYGSIYGIFALTLVMLFRANKLFNFALTEIATLFVLIALIMLKKFSYFPAMLIMIMLSLLGGALLHFGIMRFITERRNVLHSSESVMTIGFFTIINSVSTYFFGDEPQKFPSPFGEESFVLFGVGISTHSIGILIVTFGLMVSIYLFYKFSLIGLLFEAISENIVAARLRGIPASNILALAWGFTTMTATIGAILIAPTLYATPSMLSSVFAYSLIAVVIGGLESPLGAVIGGIIIGVVENLSSNIPFIGSELKFVVVVLLLFVILKLKPRGLWGRADIRRV